MMFIFKITITHSRNGEQNTCESLVVARHAHDAVMHHLKTQWYCAEHPGRSFTNSIHVETVGGLSTVDVPPSEYGFFKNRVEYLVKTHKPETTNA